MGFVAVVVFKVKDTAVFKVTPEDAAHPDVFTQAFDVGDKVADAANNEVDFNTCTCGLVEVVDGVWVDETIGLNNNTCGVSSKCVAGFRLNVALDRGL
jgi:hypothetical protein